MEKLKFWRRISNISVFTCGGAAIIHNFFREYIIDYILLFCFIEAISIIAYLISEFMKFNIKKKLNNQ